MTGAIEIAGVLPSGRTYKGWVSPGWVWITVGRFTYYATPSSAGWIKATEEDA